MSAKPKPDAQATNDSAKRQPMPFEPKKNKKKSAESPKADPQKADQASKSTKSAVSSSKPRKTTSAAQGIPDVVSRRMVQRVALFCGIPSALGMATFVVSYLAVSQGWFAVPTYAVLFVSLGWFGLGVLGVSYGALSASWDEEHVGSRLGFTEFKTNWGRMTEAWRTQNQQAKAASKKK